MIVDKSFGRLAMVAVACLTLGCGTELAAEGLEEAPAVKMEFKETKTTHKAHAQLYRWYQLYERPITPERLAFQLQILDKDIELDMTYGKAQGHDQYLAGIAALSPTDKNAHHVLQSEAKELDSETIAMETDVVYQNLKADGTLSSNKLHYTMTLEEQESGLPIFTKIRVRLVEPDKGATFADAYPESRTQSFMHYWLLLMEGVGESAAPFQELLAQDGFTLHFTSGKEPITTFEGLETWFSGVGGQIQKSSHIPKDLEVKVVSDDTFSVSVNFDWVGVANDGSLMTAETHHEWILKDTQERFLRMKEAKVTTIKPFQKVE